MKFSSAIIKKAHEMAREIKKEYVEVDYKVQFGLCLSYLLSQKEEEEKEDKKATWKDVEKACEEAVEDLGMTNFYVNEWKKYDKVRYYIELRYYRKGRCKERIACGYWDEINSEYVSYNKSKDQYDVLEKEWV